MNENGGDHAGSSGGKSWERSWTTDEMRENAHSWNLAGDSGLLKHLQDFSQTVVARTHATEKSLDSLVEEINTLAAEANTTNNKFLCLANTQFVENRVYDDDEKETPQDEPVVEKKSKEETEAKMLQRVREALSMSVAVLDTMFEPVEIQASDSEGESESDKQGTKTLILEPHNPYIHRPLPHLIGSEAFMSDDRIGLGDSPSDGEEQSLKGADYDMEVSSESDVDFTPFGASKRNRDTYSSQSSVSDHVTHEEIQGKHSKKIKPTDPIQDIGNEDEDIVKQQRGNASQPPAQGADTFAAQLSAKLGRIASPQTSTTATEEKSTSRVKTTSDDLFGGAHSEDEDDALFAGNSGLFSGRPKLFDDLEDTNNSLWGPEPSDSKKPITSDTVKTEHPVITKTQILKTGDNLFSNSMSDEEDDLFSVKATKSYKTVPTENKPKSDSLSSVASKHNHLKVNELRPGIATSTPERYSDEETQTSSSANRDKPGPFNQPLPATEVSASNPSGIPIKNEQAPSDQRVAHPSLDKKPTGGVPMFGQANVLAGLKAKLPRRPSTSSSESASSDMPVGDSNTLPPSQPAHPSDQPTNVDQGWSSAAGSFQHSQNQSIGFSSPALTSTRLTNDDGYQTRNVSNSISRIDSNRDNDVDAEDLFSSKPSSFTPQVSQHTSGGLFADVNDEEDDLFVVSSGSKRDDKKSNMNFSGKTSSSIVEPKEGSVPSPAAPSNESGNTASNISTIGSKLNTEKSFPQIEFGRNDIYSTVPPPLKSESKVKKPLSLFDDSDSGEDELLFSSASSAGSRRSQASTDILAASAISTIEKKPLAKKGLFDDDDALFGSTRNDPDIDIFSGSSKETSKPATAVETSKPITAVETSQPAPAGEASQPLSSSSLAGGDLSLKSDSSSATSNLNVKTSGKSDNTTSEKTSKPPEASKSIFQDDLFAAAADDNDDLFSSKPSSSLFANSHLFTPPDDIEDDLFGSVSKSSKMPQEKHQVNQSAIATEPKHQEGNQIEHPAPIVAPLKPPKPSLLVVSNTLEKEKDLIPSASSKTENSDSTSKAVSKPAPVELSPKPQVEQQPKKPEPPRTLNIRNETDPRLGLLTDSDDDDSDLFGSSSVKANSKPASPPKLPVKPVVAVKPETTSVSNSNKEGNSKTLPSSPDKHVGRNNSAISEVDGTVVSVSKLRDSLLAGGKGQPALKIDPRALLPGQKPPPRHTPPKEVTPVSTVLPQSKKPLSVVTGGEQAVGFDQPALNTATLPSANKDRAKLGVKRRPPSNKARREAARLSQNLDQSDKESPLSPDGSLVSAVNTSRNSSNSVLSPSTDEDDLFGVPQDLPLEYGGPSTVPSTDIFGGAPILSPIAGVNPPAQVKQEKERYQAETFTDTKRPLLVEAPNFVPEPSKQVSSDLLFEPESDQLFAPAHKVEDTASSDSLLPSKAQKVNEVSKEESFTPAPIANSQAEPISTYDDLSANTVGHEKKLKSSSAASPEIFGREHSAVFGTSDIPQTSAASHGGSKDDMAPSDKTYHTNDGESVESVIKVSLAQNESFKPSSAPKLSGESSVLDPLNKADQSVLVNEDELFGTDRSESDHDDHSSLFPFVKKKPENKQISNQPLFSQTPTLPSKADKSAPKSDLGILDEVENDDLFASSSKTLSSTKTRDTTSALKSKETKAWNFSDEDDDDLFQSGAKSVSSNASSKANSSVSSSVSSLSTNVESKIPSKPSKTPALEDDVKKSKQNNLGIKNGLFSDENDDDDLFSKPSPFLKNKLKETAAGKSSLFDGDDDDDLFGSKPKPVSSRNTPEQTKTKTALDNSNQSLTSSKLKKGNVFDDPLMALKDDK